jgi:23S rRNA pseudouridine1911/1915/1917 synthase
MPQTARFEVAEQTPDTERRIDRVVRALTQMTVRPAQGLVAQGGVKLNGAVCQEPWKRLAPGDQVEVEFEPGRRYKTPAKPRSFSGFEIVFEDEYLLVVNKQAGLLTVPTERRETNTLLHRLSTYLARGQRFRPKVWIVHRLDRGVSGLLVFAKRPETATALREQLAERKPVRRYLAIVAGEMAQQNGTFESYLATNKSLTRYSTDDPAAGEHAITHFCVVERLPGVTVVEVWLETGRRNQIRVHLAEAGHPVLGDERYRPGEAKHRLWTAKRLALQATELGFIHPASGEACHYSLPLAPELRRFLAMIQPRSSPPA